MPIHHTNRFGDRYTLLEGSTSAGKPKYHFSRKGKGKPVAALPAGQEIFESASGQVFLRPVGSAVIRPAEVETVSATLKKLGLAKGFEAWPNKLDITLYEFSGLNDDLYDELARRGPMLMSREQYVEYRRLRAPRVAMMRFVLRDPAERVFAPERYCFRGAVDDWISIGEPGALPPLCRKFLPHLGQESIYELY